jgi:signal transduction histidine kinase
MLETPLRRLCMTVLALAAVLLLVVAAQHRTSGSLLPHGYCFTWNPTLLWAHVASDALIGTAYVSIPLTLIYLVRKRTDLPFNWIVVLFATFIVSCGATHWIEVWTVWNPDYWLSAIVKMITATASVLTAAALIYLVPRILAIPTMEALNLAKAELEAEVSRRIRIEDELRAKSAELELRVSERTAALSKATEEARAAHSAAHEANLQKDRFLAKVSHELRTPLQSTLTWVTVLKTPGLDASRVALATQRIAHNVAAQARLIDDLLDISRILSGKLLLQWRVVDPVKIVAQAVSVVQDARPEARIDVDFASAAPTIRTDPVRLEQVAWNLINNAVQACVAQGRVLVTLRVTPDELRLDVQDWGAGIAVDELSSIFEPFLQRNSTGNQHRGLGLGLAIVRSIVRLLGGNIQASSPGPGAGATFSVSLPLAQSEETTEDGPSVLPRRTRRNP